jgi:hypothetical protein
MTPIEAFYVGLIVGALAVLAGGLLYAWLRHL